MSTSYLCNVTLQDVLASVKTLGFLTGIAASLLLVVILAILDAWRSLKRRRSLLTIAMDDNGSEFKLSLKAIKTHLRCYLSQVYPQLTLESIRLGRKGKGICATVVVVAECGQSMHGLSETVMADLQRSLNDIMGMKDLFTRVDVVVNGLKDDGQPHFTKASPEEAPLQEQQPKPDDLDSLRPPLTLLSDDEAPTRDSEDAQL